MEALPPAEEDNSIEELLAFIDEEFVPWTQDIDEDASEESTEIVSV